MRKQQVIRGKWELELNERLNQIFDQMQVAKANNEEYQAYKESLKTYRDLKNTLDTAYDEGKKRGKQERWEKSLKKGREEERAIQREKNKANAKKMKEKGVSNTDISQFSGLSEDDINDL